MTVWDAGAIFSFLLGLLLIVYSEKYRHTPYPSRQVLQLINLCGWIFLMWSVVIAVGIWAAST